MGWEESRVPLADPVEEAIPQAVCASKATKVRPEADPWLWQAKSSVTLVRIPVMGT